MTTSAYAILAALRHAPDSTCGEVAKVVGCADDTARKALLAYTSAGQVERRAGKRKVRAPFGDGSEWRKASVHVFRVRDGATA